MISESQERMVAVVEPARLDEVRAACARWELPCTVIGEVTDHGELRVVPRRRDRRRDPGRAPHREDASLRARAPRAGPPALAADRDPVNDEPKTWVFEQYDQLVGSRTVRRPGLRRGACLRDSTGTLRGLAVSLDGPDARRARPVPRRPPGGDEGGAQRRLRRRRAARAHRLPQLRQPGAARDRLGALAGDRRHRRGRRTSSGSRSSPATSRSTTRPAAGRSRRPRSSAASGSSPTSRRIPSRWRARRPRRCFLRGEGAELIAFVWRNARRFTLAHDVSDGRGRAGATRGRRLERASRARFAAPEGAGVLVALAPADDAPLAWPDVVELGLV